MRSANDVAVAIAETLGGDEPSFVKQMNQTAARLGMAHTHFINPNGLPAEQQVTTARDMALLAQALLRDFPEHALALLPRRRRRSARSSSARTTRCSPAFPAATASRPGYTCASGYNLVASATRDGRRLIAVVLGETRAHARTNARAAALLENGFRTRQWKPLFPTPRVENLPTEVVGAGFEPDAGDARALPRVQGAAPAAARPRLDAGERSRKSTPAKKPCKAGPPQEEARAHPCNRTAQ